MTPWSGSRFAWSVLFETLQGVHEVHSENASKMSEREMAADSNLQDVVRELVSHVKA